MYWFWFWLVMIALDAAWWAVAMRLTKRRWWRVVVSVFMAGQIAAVFSDKICGLKWPLYAPKFLLVAILVWHRFVLPFALGVFLLLAIVSACAWIAGRRSQVAGLWRNRAVPTPPAANSLTRREFIGAFATLTPPLFTIGSTAVALAQLNHFRVRRFTLSIPALPRALDGITIAHVSDMHVGRLTCGRVLREMVNRTNALRADLVLLTGDLIHDHLADLSDALGVVKAMEGRYGLRMIEGNHDLFENGDEFDRRVKAAGVPLLLDE